MSGSRGRLSSSVFLSGAFLLVWAAGARAQVPFEGGTWSFSGVIREKDCGTSTSFRGGRRTVTTGCFLALTPFKFKERTVEVRPGRLPALTLSRCRGDEVGQLKQFVRYVPSRTNPRRFVLHIDDRAALTEVFASCLVPPGAPPVTGYRLRWSSIVTVSADGQRVRQRDVQWDSWDDTSPRRARSVTTASIRGKRTGDVTTTASVGEDTSDLAN